MLSSVNQNPINSTIVSNDQSKIDSNIDIPSNSFELALNESSNIQEIEEVSNKPSEQALKNFYEIHQRSQITGVPTREYNNAVKELGIDISQSDFHGKARELLEQYQYQTDFPSEDAVLKYGNTQQDHGNRAYMIGNANYPTGIMFEKAENNTYNEYVEEIREEIKLGNSQAIQASEDLENSTINSIIPQAIVLNDNNTIDTKNLISTLELLLAKPNLVNNDIEQSITNTIDFLNSLNKEEDKEL